jgi:hypothetical protein
VCGGVCGRGDKVGREERKKEKGREARAKLTCTIQRNRTSVSGAGPGGASKRPSGAKNSFSEGICTQDEVRC